MSQQGPWVDEIINVLKELGGHGSYKDIYDRILDRNNMKLTVKWKSVVRDAIERNSSDSEKYTGKRNIFYSVDGIGNGHWGLLDFEPHDNNVDITDDDLGFVEGKKALKQHIYRERNPKVIKLAKEKFKAENGKLYCEACNFNFEEKYGDIGQDFIEGHHIIPVSQIPDGYKTKVDDIIMLCSNCHKMIHRKKPWLKRNELYKLFI